MSYTHQKVIWEPCHIEDKDTETYLLDVNGNLLLDVDLKKLVSSDEYVDIYGDSIVDIYGDIIRKDPIEVIVRKQPHEEVIRTNEGREVLTKSYFYVDPKIERNALNIGYMDKLDGETVMKKYIMCDLYGRPKMLRFITI